MANHRSFTNQDLLNAASELEKQGKPINGNALRRIVGSGRPSSLMDAYNELLAVGKIQLPEKNNKETDTIESYDLPSEIKEELELGLQAITSMITRCNDLAHHVVEQRLNKAIDEAKKARIDAENAMAEANDNESKAWDEVDSIQTELKSTQDLNDSQAKRIIELEQQLKASEKTITTMQLNIDNLNKDLGDTKSKLESAEKHSATTNGKLAEIRNQLANTQKELEAERGLIANLTNEQKELMKNTGTLEGQLKSAKLQTEKATYERDTAVKDALLLNDRVKLLTVEKTEIESTLEAVRSELKDAIAANKAKTTQKKSQ